MAKDISYVKWSDLAAAGWEFQFFAPDDLADKTGNVPWRKDTPQALEALDYFLLKGPALKFLGLAPVRPPYGSVNRFLFELPVAAHVDLGVERAMCEGKAMWWGARCGFSEIGFLGSKRLVLGFEFRDEPLVWFDVF